MPFHTTLKEIEQRKMSGSDDGVMTPSGNVSVKPVTITTTPTTTTTITTTTKKKIIQIVLGCAAAIGFAWMGFHALRIVKNSFRDAWKWFVWSVKNAIIDVVKEREMCVDDAHVDVWSAASILNKGLRVLRYNVQELRWEFEAEKARKYA